MKMIEDINAMGDKRSLGIICCGGRHFNCFPLLEYAIDEIISKNGIDKENVTIISGHCQGADLLGEKYARENNVACKIFPANWTKYGKAAGPIRNSEMVNFLSCFDKGVVLAFKSNQTRGTNDTINKARRKGYEVYVCEYETTSDGLNLFEGVSWDDKKFRFDFYNDDKEGIVMLTKQKIR